MGLYFTKYIICRYFSCFNRKKIKTVPCRTITCEICFETVEVLNTNYYDCNHNNFCLDCVNDWSTRGNNCPLCRADVIPKKRCLFMI